MEVEAEEETDDESGAGVAIVTFPAGVARPLPGKRGLLYDTISREQAKNVFALVKKRVMISTCTATRPKSAALGRGLLI